MTNIEEIWKDIPSFNGMYQASNLGRIRSQIRGLNRIRKPQLTLRNYYGVMLHKNNVVKNYNVHRLVMWAFYGESALVVNHKDGNKLNNVITNLEYSTVAENNRHALVNNLLPYGSRRNDAKLTEMSISVIKETYALKRGTLREIANYFNVSSTLVHKIVNHKTWRHVPPYDPSGLPKR